MVWRWDQILQTAHVWPLAGLRLVVTAGDGMKSAEISGRHCTLGNKDDTTPMFFESLSHDFNGLCTE